jgi:HlyD family secretion protein
LVNPLTRTAVVEIELPNPQHLLKPGMFARVQITLGKKEDVILIPTHAIVEETGQKKVFLVQDGKAVSRMVESGATQDGWIEIKTGLAEGDSLIVAGQYLVKENEPVKVVSSTGGEN